mmetsp:Transcript_111573/g.315059  ORF Transcript_111573/g.315059 Transcript_111573/m.315059 type:complete len:613 (-) Transcript_111573:2912-4750(-)
MTLQELVEVLQIVGVYRVGLLRIHAAHLDVRKRDACLETVDGIPNPRDAAAHASAEVLTSSPEHRDTATCHVLAAMVACALDHGPGAGVAHGEALRTNAAHEANPRGRTVKASVADNDILFGHEAILEALPVWVNREGAAAEALAEVVLSVALELQEDTAHCEGAKRLARRTDQLRVACTRFQRIAPAPVKLVGQERADSPVGVAHVGKLEIPHVAETEGLRETCHELAIEQRVEHGEVVLLVQFPVFKLPNLARVGQAVCRDEDRQEVQRRVGQRGVHTENIRLADELVEVSEAELRHHSARLLGNKHEIVHDVLRHAFELLTKHRVLRRDANRARVEVALPHHDAAHGDERCRGEAKPLCAEQRRDHDVTPGSQLPIGLESDPASEAVQHKRLVRLCQPQFPRSSGMLDACPLGRTGATIATADEDVVRLALCDTRRNDPDADFADELHAHICGRVGVFKVENQLRKVLDRVNIVVWGRRNETHARCRTARLCNVADHLAAGKFSALARLRSLCHFDLQLRSVAQVFHRHPETPGGHLLYRGLHRIAVGQRPEAERVLPALASVGVGADTVHRDRERRMRLHRNGTVGHCAGAEALNDVARWLHRLEWDW